MRDALSVSPAQLPRLKYWLSPRKVDLEESRRVSVLYTGHDKEPRGAQQYLLYLLYIVPPLTHLLEDTLVCRNKSSTELMLLVLHMRR